MNKFKLMLFGMFSVLSIATLLCISKVDSFAAIDYNDRSEVTINVKPVQDEPAYFKKFGVEMIKLIDDNGIKYSVCKEGNDKSFYVEKLPNLEEIVIPDIIVDENGTSYVISNSQNWSFSSCEDTTDIKFPSAYRPRLDFPEMLLIDSCKNLKNINIPESIEPGHVAIEFLFSTNNSLQNVYFEDGLIIENDQASCTLGEEVVNENLNVYFRNQNGEFEKAGKATEIFDARQDNVIDVDDNLLIYDIAYINGMEIQIVDGNEPHAEILKTSGFRDVVIPQNINLNGVLYPVTKIEWRAIQKTVETIVFPESLRNLENEDEIDEFGLLFYDINSCRLEKITFLNPEITMDTIQELFNFNWNDNNVTICVKNIDGQLNEVIFPVEEEAQEPEFDMELFLQENFHINLPEPQVLQEDLLDENGEVKDCCICYGPMSADNKEEDNEEEGNEVITLHCGHVFHAPCIQKWAENHWRCPYCQEPMQ